MKFGNFLLPYSGEPKDDFIAINDALYEATLTDELGFDAVWLGEHHTDGVCAYVDPITFAGAVVARTAKTTIGFSAVQMALHHPVRLAEQVSLLDNLSKGRIILGLGRGTAFNFYEYRAYGVAFSEAQSRLLESEEIITGVWMKKGFTHQGKHFQVELDTLRPHVYQTPHPPLIRAVATEASIIEMGKLGRLFMLVAQSNAETFRLFNIYRNTMLGAGYSIDRVESNLRQCWVWRNICVADNDTEAEQLALAAYDAAKEHISTIRRRLNTQAENAFVESSLANPRFAASNSLIYGSPETVSEHIETIQKIGVGGLIIHFRVGTLTRSDNEHSLRLFAGKVMSEFQ